MPRATFALGAALLAAAITAGADTRRIQSPAGQVMLLELFTSEGCSSCPPADRWLSGLVDDPRLWRQVVPVAFHVDYWDSIGWPDRFAHPAFSERQRMHARGGVVRSVYTPGFVARGEEWRGWFRRPVLDVASPPPAGILSLDVDTATGRIDGRYTAAHALDGPLELHVALLGFDLQTEVRAGENEGRTLRHDFVVLGHARVPLDGASPRFHAATTLPDARVDAPRRALAAWVSRANDTRALQAAGGWLP